MAQMKKTEKYRNRTHLLMLYPEDAMHMDALKKIEKSYDYAYILHDKDCDENGEIKKPHYHVVVRFSNQTWSTALAKELGITENYLEEPRSFDNALMYLIHFNDGAKYQYSLDEVKGTLKNRLREKINSVDKTEGEKVFELIEYIENQKEEIKITNFAKYCAMFGYWAEFRRSGMIFCKVIEEHNGAIAEKHRREDLDRNAQRMAELTKDYQEERRQKEQRFEQTEIDFDSL